MAALRRLRPAAAAAAAAARCELCAQPLGGGHEHVLERESGRIGCACTACALLFEGEGRAWRRLPRDSRALGGFELSAAEWAGLGIPIGLAFFWRAGGGEGCAAYPSPGGAVRATIAPEAWAALEAAHPELGAMANEVEALLLNRMEGRQLAFVVPLDQAYRLVGLIRSAWSGWGGGPEVGRALRRYWAELEEGGAGHA
ncbi:MAG TPA: DUF5947 family protein [Terriglobales bacterium]|nr:DUF5947 family protein [Terriglobales bacterium]